MHLGLRVRVRQPDLLGARKQARLAILVAIDHRTVPKHLAFIVFDESL